MTQSTREPSRESIKRNRDGGHYNDTREEFQSQQRSHTDGDVRRNGCDVAPSGSGAAGRRSDLVQSLDSRDPSSGSCGVACEPGSASHAGESGTGGGSGEEGEGKA